MNELWFKIKYLPYIRNKQITVTIREGMRDQFHPKGYKIGERVILRCFQKPSINELQLPIVVTNLVFKKIRDLSENNLVGGPPDSLTKEAVKDTLEILYNRKFLDDEVVTLVHFRYEEKSLLP